MLLPELLLQLALQDLEVYFGCHYLLPLSAGSQVILVCRQCHFHSMLHMRPLDVRMLAWYY